MLGATNPAHFGLYARRRMAPHGDTPEDFARVEVKNAAAGAANPLARHRTLVTAAEVAASPVVADPMRLLDVCATSDGGAVVVLSGLGLARHPATPDPVRIRVVSTVTPVYPRTVPDLPDIGTDSALAAAPPEPAAAFRSAVVRAAYEEAGIGPEDLDLDMDLAEVHDLSTALELDWYEDLGLCRRAGRKLLRDGATALGGRNSGQSQRRAPLLRGGRARPGARPGVRADLAGARPVGAPAGRGGPRRGDGEPGPVRARLVGGRNQVICPIP